MSGTSQNLNEMDDASFLNSDASELLEEASTSGSSNVVNNQSDVNDGSVTDANEQPYTDSLSTESVTTPDDPEKLEDDDLELPEDFDYKSAYLSLHKPLKANGTTVRIKSDEELRTLVQQGLGYTSKSQKLAEDTKIASMLRENGIQKGDLSLLIDLHKKDPKAIQKFLQDAQVDPLDVDYETPSSYETKDYEVKDNELKFREVLGTLRSTDSGNKFIEEIGKWDDQTKAQAWNDPAIVEILYQQQTNGVYPRIAAEIERRRLVGTLSYDVPFLTAYQSVGEQMLRQATQGSNAGDVVTKRVVEPKSPVRNGDRIRKTGGSSTRSTNTPVDLSRLTDDDFMKLS